MTRPEPFQSPHRDTISILARMTDLRWRGDSPVFRTDFTHPAEWAAIRAAIVEPQEEGFMANVEFVDDRSYEGLTPARLLEIVPAGAAHRFAFLVDEQTLTHPDRPIQVVNLYDYRAGPRSGDTFRVIPSEMWSVQNNLSLANMDWAEFADSTDEDGIFRGFA